jgi:hypothetical protein
VVPVIAVSYVARGGSKKSVVANIVYTISSRTPTNHADRPLLETIVAAIVLTKIMITAPGQKIMSIGVGPST